MLPLQSAGVPTEAESTSWILFDVPKFEFNNTDESGRVYCRVYGRYIDRYVFEGDRISKGRVTI